MTNPPIKHRFRRWHRQLNSRLVAAESHPVASPEARVLYRCGYTPRQAAEVLA